MGRDHEEIEALARDAILAEMRRCAESGEQIAPPVDRGHMQIAVALPNRVAAGS